MPSTEANKAISSLGGVISPINGTIECFPDIQNDTNLPKAFSTVFGHLPLVSDILSSMRLQLRQKKADEETQDDKESYLQMKKTFDECLIPAQRLEELFGAVTSDDPTPWIERYREAVNGGSRLETAMVDLLSRLAKVTKPPFVGENNLAALDEALDEVKALPPTLKEEPVPTHVFHNHGNGIQPIHLGRGHVNINSGSAPQFTGDTSGGTFNMMPTIPNVNA
ncbi:hypothetical protein AK830_g4616 [Neonectria ditissima]|uniref:NACHT-NTPase and P-loop NTPases N-terminal domain-containing protein n=1 Tax=Neonectria ditissima TaxID=78410 RepID=A0A0P7B7R9_9HYPO|nr:hypothetical protein AK830_g4616 [Neonectria ditissima]